MDKWFLTPSQPRKVTSGRQLCLGQVFLLLISQSHVQHAIFRRNHMYKSHNSHLEPCTHSLCHWTHHRLGQWAATIVPEVKIPMDYRFVGGNDLTLSFQHWGLSSPSRLCSLATFCCSTQKLWVPHSKLDISQSTKPAAAILTEIWIIDMLEHEYIWSVISLSALIES